MTREELEHLLRAAATIAERRDVLVIIEGSNTKPGRGLCLEPHDLVIAKLIAHREKDLEFANALIGARLVDERILLSRLASTSGAAPIQVERVRVWLRRRSPSA